MLFVLLLQFPRNNQVRKFPAYLQCYNHATAQGLQCTVWYNYAFLFADIINSPQSVNVSLNEIALFNCTGFAEFIRWNVNGNPLDNRVGFKQITVLLNQTQSLRRSTLSVVASLQNNNTKIKCLAFNLSPLTFTNSEPAVLHIQGN